MNSGLKELIKYLWEPPDNQIIELGWLNREPTPTSEVISLPKEPLMIGTSCPPLLLLKWTDPENMTRSPEENCVEKILLNAPSGGYTMQLLSKYTSNYNKYTILYHQNTLYTYTHVYLVHISTCIPSTHILMYT